MNKALKLLPLAAVLAVCALIFVYFVPLAIYKKSAKEKAGSLPEVQLLDTSSWLTYDDSNFKFKIRYPHDWKFSTDPAFDCPVFYNEKYPMINSSRVASVSLCKDHEYFLPKQASDFMKRLESTKGFEIVALGYENYGLIGEAPGASIMSFAEGSHVYGLSMIPLTWREESGERKYLSPEEDAELRKIFRTMVSTIEPR